MSTLTIKPDYNAHIASIINDCYPGCTNCGPVTDHITASVKTSDFDLPNNYKVRIHLEKGIVYYSIFRSK